MKRSRRMAEEVTSLPGGRPRFVTTGGTLRGRVRENTIFCYALHLTHRLRTLRYKRRLRAVHRTVKRCLDDLRTAAQKPVEPPGFEMPQGPPHSEQKPERGETPEDPIHGSSGGPTRRGPLSALAKRFPNAALRYHRTRSLLQQIVKRWRLIPNTIRWFSSLFTALRARRREPRLTVAVDIGAFWEPLTGIGWYLYRLLEHLAEREDLCLRLYGPWIVDSPDAPQPVVEIPSGRAIEHLKIAVPDDLFVPAGRIIGWLRRLEPLMIGWDRSKVLFAPNYFLPGRFTLGRGARVSTIHDLGVLEVPWTLRQETLDELSKKLERSVKTSRRLITVSAAVRDELAEHRLADPARVDVVHHGPGQLAELTPREPSSSLPPRFGLHVGTLEPRKNILYLIDAWRRARAQSPEVPALVLSGRYGWKTDEIQPAVESAVAEGWLHHLGYVDAEELAWLYREAQLVAFPSLYEGFGLPAIEALWAGSPLLCSDIPVLREVAGDAALYAPSDRPEEFAARIAEIATDPQLSNRLVESGRRRAQEFQWALSAERTAGVFHRAAKKGLG